MPQRFRALVCAPLTVLLSVSALTPASATTLTWSIVPTPNPGGASSGNFLESVSCASATACMAVGEHSAHRESSLAESWNGSTWSVVPIPSPPGAGNGLSSVSCTSPTSCVAVGGNLVGQPPFTNSQTLVESWNGAKWSIVPSPNGPPPNSGLDSVSCVTANACTAVGGAGHGFKTLIESWDGAKWVIVPAPAKGPEAFSRLGGVSCLSASFCMAVGDHNSSATRTLAESWNGTTWSVLPSPNAGGTAASDYLDGVSCASPSACMAVGNYDPTICTLFPLSESWNGKRWSIVATPHAVDALYAVSCAAQSVCTADGRTTSSKTAIEAWDGARWSLVANPHKRNASSELFGVSCPAVTTCTGVGYYFRTGSGGRTLAEVGKAAG